MALMGFLNIAGAVVYASRVSVLLDFSPACGLQTTDTRALVSNSVRFCRRKSSDLPLVGVGGGSCAL
jgi:hypothetical protein